MAWPFLKVYNFITDIPRSSERIPWCKSLTTSRALGAYFNFLLLTFRPQQSASSFLSFSHALFPLLIFRFFSEHIAHSEERGRNYNILERDLDFLSRLKIAWPRPCSYTCRISSVNWTSKVSHDACLRPINPYEEKEIAQACRYDKHDTECGTLCWSCKRSIFLILIFQKTPFREIKGKSWQNKFT